MGDRLAAGLVTGQSFCFCFVCLFILPGTMFGLRRSPTETRGNNSDTVLLFNGQQW